jgi:hypothetical protein
MATDRRIGPGLRGYQMHAPIAKPPLRVFLAKNRFPLFAITF